MRYNRGTGDYAFTDRESKKLLKRMTRESNKSREAYDERLQRYWFIEQYWDGKQVYDKDGRILVGHEIAGAPSQTGDVDDEVYIFNMARRIDSSNQQRLTSFKLEVTVPPRSMADEDKGAARDAKTVARDILQKNNETKLKRELAWYLGKRGTAFLGHGFNPLVGDWVHPYIEDKVAGAVVDETRKVRQGEIEIFAIDPANSILPDGCESLAKADWFEHYEILSRSEIYRLTGVMVEKESIEPDMFSLAGPNNESRNTDYKDHAILRVRYHRRSMKYSKGAIFVYTSQNMIRSTELDKFYDDIPVSVAHAIYNAKSPFGETWLWDLIPNCSAINMYMTNITNYTKLLPKLNMQAPTNADITLSKIDNGTGNIYRYKGEKGLEALKFPELPQSTIQGYNLVYNSALSLGAAHNITRSNKVLSGNALGILEQIDDSMLGPCLRQLEELWEETLNGCLSCVDRYWDTPRTVRATGSRGWEVIEDFNGAKLRGHIACKVKFRQDLSNNAMDRELIFRAHKEGVLPTEKAQLYLEFTSEDEVWEKLQKKDQIAASVIKGITDFPGNYVEVQRPNPQNPAEPMTGWECRTRFHSFDDHAFLAEKLREYMQENFDHIEEEVVKATLRRHLEEHENMLQPMMPPPGPGGPGAGPGGPPGPKPTPPPLAPDSVQNQLDQPPADQGKPFSQIG